jgi:hypothetical protein
MKYLIFLFIVHLYPLDSNISKMRRDYEVIDAEQIDDEISDESDHEEEESLQKESEPEIEHVEEVKDDSNSKFRDLIKTGNSDDGEDDREDDKNNSDSDSIEEINAEDYNPSFLSFAVEENEESVENSNPSESIEQPKEKLDEDSKIFSMTSQNSEFVDIKSCLEQMKDAPTDALKDAPKDAPKDYNIEQKEMMIDHPLAFKHDNKNEGFDFPEPVVKEEIMVNNQNFENNFFNKKYEEDKEELFYPVADVKYDKKKKNPKHRQSK